jgi:hypothetical protein
MTTGDIILHMFRKVDDDLPDIGKHPQSILYPIEFVTIGILLCIFPHIELHMYTRVDEPVILL